MEEKELLRTIKLLHTKLLSEPNGRRTTTGVCIEPSSHIYCQNAEKLIEHVNNLKLNCNTDYAALVLSQDIGSWRNHELLRVSLDSSKSTLSETMRRSNARMERIFMPIFQKIDEIL